jgi:hypothetical protein
VLPWNQAQPSAYLAAVLESLWVSNFGDKSRRDDRADATVFHQALTRLTLFSQRLNPMGHALQMLLDLSQMFQLLNQCWAQQSWQRRPGKQLRDCAAHAVEPMWDYEAKFSQQSMQLIAQLYPLFDQPLT